jgi:hypothetical protein
MFDVLFQGVFETIPVGDVDAGVLVTEIMVWPDSDIFVVWVSIDFIVWVAGEGICTVRGSRFVFKQDIILFLFREVSCDARSDFSGVAIVL